MASTTTTPRLNDDLRMLRARFYLQQYNDCKVELAQLSTDVPQYDRELWQRRIILETQLTQVAQNQFPKAADNTSATDQTDPTDTAFQEHMMNLYALFVLSPQNDTKIQILQQLEAYMYQPELHSNIFLHLYGGLMLWRGGKVALARDLLTRVSSPQPLFNGASSTEPAEFLLEKLYIMVQICLSKSLLNETQQIIDEMVKIDNDDILVQLAKLDLAVAIPSPKPDMDEESTTLQLSAEIISRYGPCPRPMVLQSSELIRQGNYRQAYGVLKQAKEWCVTNGGVGNGVVPAEVWVNSIICLHYRGYSALSVGSSQGQQQLPPSYQQQQQQVEAMIANLEQELKQMWPNHPYFGQREAILAQIEEGIKTAGITRG